jgi:hypothetical protein
MQNNKTEIKFCKKCKQRADEIINRYPDALSITFAGLECWDDLECNPKLLDEYLQSNDLSKNKGNKDSRHVWITFGYDDIPNNELFLTDEQLEKFGTKNFVFDESMLSYEQNS